MDSITQFALGAAVSGVLLGPKIGARKAVLLGGVLGTLPDLDTFLPSADAVQAFAGHRSATHSLIMQAIATPIIAEPLVRVVRSLRDARILTYVAVYLVFATHAMIDAMTVYGTQLLWPLTDTPFGVGSIFIIDPLYTLPLLVVTLWGLFLAQWSTRFARALKGALVFSTAYMLLTIPLQQMMDARAHNLLKAEGITPERQLTIPTPFNVVYWRTIAIDGARLINLDMPLFGDASTTLAYAHARRPDLAGCLIGTPVFDTLAAFTKGFFRLELDGERVIMTDLRMGLTPNHVFRFHIANATPDGAVPISPPTRETVVRGTDGDIPWIIAGISQNPTPRPAEQTTQISLNDTPPAMVRDLRHLVAPRHRETLKPASEPRWDRTAARSST